MKHWASSVTPPTPGVAGRYVPPASVRTSLTPPRGSGGVVTCRYGSGVACGTSFVAASGSGTRPVGYSSDAALTPPTPFRVVPPAQASVFGGGISAPTAAQGATSMAATSHRIPAQALTPTPAPAAVVGPAPSKAEEDEKDGAPLTPMPAPTGTSRTSWVAPDGHAAAFPTFHKRSGQQSPGQQSPHQQSPLPQRPRSSTQQSPQKARQPSPPHQRQSQAQQSHQMLQAAQTQPAAQERAKPQPQPSPHPQMHQTLATQAAQQPQAQQIHASQTEPAQTGQPTEQQAQAQTAPSQQVAPAPQLQRQPFQGGSFAVPAGAFAGKVPGGLAALVPRTNVSAPLSPTPQVPTPPLPRVASVPSTVRKSIGMQTWQGQAGATSGSVNAPSHNPAGAANGAHVNAHSQNPAVNAAQRLQSQPQASYMLRRSSSSAAASTLTPKLPADLEQVKREMEHLRAENAALREEQASSAETQSRLRAENVELRDQVRDHKERIDALCRQMVDMHEAMQSSRSGSRTSFKHAADVQAQVVEAVAASFGRDGGGNAVRSASTALGSSPAESLSPEPGTPPSPASLFATPTQRPTGFAAAEDEEPRSDSTAWRASESQGGQVKRYWVQDDTLLTSYGRPSEMRQEIETESLTATQRRLPAAIPASRAAQDSASSSCHKLGEIRAAGDGQPRWEERVAAPTGAGAWAAEARAQQASSITVQLADLKAQMAAVAAQQASLRAATRAVEEEYMRVRGSSETPDTSSAAGSVEGAHFTPYANSPPTPSGAPSLGLPVLGSTADAQIKSMSTVPLPWQSPNCRSASEQ